MKHSLFRTIRRKLLEEGKLLRYLTYAIGEVVLIIVGILMALKINDWNEERKAQERLHLYVAQLKEDVSLAIEILDEEVADAESKTARSLFLLKKLKGESIAPSEVGKFEFDLNALGRMDEVDISIGYLAGLLEGDLGAMAMDRELSLKTLRLVRRIKQRLTSSDDKVRIMHQVDATIMKYRGRFMRKLPELQMSYDLDHLRSSKEFIYAVENWTEAVAAFGNALAIGRGDLEAFLAFLEEYE